MYNKYIKTDNKKKQHVYYANITTTRHFAYSKKKDVRTNSTTWPEIRR